MPTLLALALGVLVATTTACAILLWAIASVLYNVRGLLLVLLEERRPR
jgi:hypothetical protein